MTIAPFQALLYSKAFGLHAADFHDGSLLVGTLMSNAIS
jgi:hypothetical protein